MIRRSWLLALLVCITAGVASGQVVDYQLQVCNQGITCPGTDPNMLTGSNFQVFENGNGSPAVLDPLLVIVGIPNGGAAPGTLTYACTSGTGCSGGTNTASLLNGSYWGGTFSSSGTAFTSSSKDAYTALGLPQGPTGTASESFTNWTGVTGATSYTLYAYALFGTGLSGGNAENFTLANLPKGTIIIAFSCSTGSNTATCTSQGNNQGATPFTQAGGVGVASEPATTAMLITTGLLWLMGPVRRKYCI